MKFKVIFIFSAAVLLLFSITACKVKTQTADVPGAETADSTVETVEPAQPEDSLMVFYGRTPCFGMCPYFELRIYKSGYAVYEGKNFVDMIGYYHTTFDRASLQKVMTAAEGIGYFGLLDSYDNPRVTDLPAVTTTLVHNGKSKTVTGRYKAPRELEQVYHELDFMIENAKWSALQNRQ